MSARQDISLLEMAAWLSESREISVVLGLQVDFVQSTSHSPAYNPAPAPCLSKYAMTIVVNNVQLCGLFKALGAEARRKARRETKLAELHEKFIALQTAVSQSVGDRVESVQE